MYCYSLHCWSVRPFFKRCVRSALLPWPRCRQAGRHWGLCTGSHWSGAGCGRAKPLGAMPQCNFVHVALSLRLFDMMYLLKSMDLRSARFSRDKTDALAAMLAASNLPLSTTAGTGAAMYGATTDSQTLS